MKRALVVACLLFGLLALASCASNTATTQPEKKPVGWGTVDTIESESVK